MIMEKANNEVKEKKGLYLAIEQALAQSTEKERIIAILDCIKGYRNEYDVTNEKGQFEGFYKCKSEFNGQIKKVKDFILNHNF